MCIGVSVSARGRFRRIRGRIIFGDMFKIKITRRQISPAVKWRSFICSDPGSLSHIPLAVLLSSGLIITCKEHMAIKIVAGIFLNRYI
jgi:hypothetical protein